MIFSEANLLITLRNIFSSYRPGGGEKNPYSENIAEI